MPKHNRKLLVAAILFLLIIWGNSLLPASISAQMSGWLARLLAGIPGIHDIGAGEGLLRKLAHVLEFVTLGSILALLRERLNRPWSLLVLCGMAVALIDETIQLFSTGRAAMVADVWIDMSGFMLGILVSNVAGRLRSRRVRGGEKFE